MTKKIEDGGPAFPVLGNVGYNSDWVSEDGMSLRDHFAGRALVGLLASGTFSNSGNGFEAFISEKAFNLADAMLAARKSGGEA